jgi:stage V sporulation protein D (sporulation-specific penicillin-binding protein)
MLGRTDSRRRLLFLLVTFAVVAAALVTRLAYWQVGQRDRLAAAALSQTTMRVESPSRRGDIYDRSGVVVLATTVERERLAATPSELTPDRRRVVAAALVGMLGLADDEARALTDRMTSERQYVVLAHGLDTATADRIRAASAAKEIEGVTLEKEPVRVYPHEGGGPGTTLAAHMLGFVNRDGVGQYGVEQYYQGLLNGSPRIVHAQRDISARAIPETVVIDDPGTPGVDLRLTIDAGLQLALEQELLAAQAADQAQSVSAVVMDPYTGEVLAEASYP